MTSKAERNSPKTHSHRKESERISAEVARKAQSVFVFLPANGVELFLPTQVVREYLVVATRPEKINGLGLAIEDAVESHQYVEEHLRHFTSI